MELKGRAEQEPAAWKPRRGDWFGLQTRRGSARRGGRDEVNRMMVDLCAVQRWSGVYHRG